MSALVLARKYFTDLAVSLKFRKHYDGFATNNIPRTTFDRTFHVEAFSFSGSPQVQGVLSVLASPCVVRLFFKGFRNVDEAIETATREGELYIDEALKITNRLNYEGAEVVKNIVLSQFVVEPFAVSNDNYVVARIEFDLLISKNVC